MSRGLVAFIALAVASCSLAVVPAASTTVKQTADEWVGDFDTGDFSQWTGIQRFAPDRIRLVTSPVRDGLYAARFEVDPGDYSAGPTGERAELFVATPDNPGTEWYYAWSTLFPKDFSTDGSWKHMFVQWHGPGSSGASVSFQVWHGRLVARVGSPYTPTQWQQFDLGPLVHDVWQDFIFHVRWAADGSGFVEIWRNGVHVVPLKHGINCAPGQANYLKLGYYRDPSPTPAVLYEDAMRRGNSLSQVIEPFRLKFVSPPTLSGRMLSFEAGTFAAVRVAVTVRAVRTGRVLLRKVLWSDGSGRLSAQLALRQGVPGPMSVRLRALVDKALAKVAGRASAPVQRP
jgi:hypothetical protein